MNHPIRPINEVMRGFIPLNAEQEITKNEISFWLSYFNLTLIEMDHQLTAMADKLEKHCAGQIKFTRYH